MQTRIAPFALTAVLLGGGVAAATAGPASASEQAPTTAQACRDTARNYTGTPGSGSSNAHWPATGSYARTTSNCVDINVKISDATRRVRTCFRASGSCNAWKTATTGRWVLAATNVVNATDFYIQFEGTRRSTGQIAF